MRAFIAIDLPQSVKDIVSRMQSRLKLSGADVSWVSPANMHLTLKFLGDIDEAAAIAVSEAIRDIAARTCDFTMQLGSIGAFPGVQSPRIIWVGLSKGHEQARAIAAQIESRIEKYGIGRETKPFASHITIGRVRSKKNIRQLTDGIGAADIRRDATAEEFKAGKITFFKSTLTPQGPVYEKLQETNLKTA